MILIIGGICIGFYGIFVFHEGPLVILPVLWTIALIAAGVSKLRGGVSFDQSLEISEAARRFSQQHPGEQHQPPGEAGATPPAPTRPTRQ